MRPIPGSRQSRGRIDGMGRDVVLFAVIALLGGCKTSVDDITLLDLETLRFKDANEEIRVDDLLARYEKRRKRADALSEQLLDLQHQRERAFEAYDKLHGDLAKVERQRAAAERSREAAAAALRKAKHETTRLRTELDKERRAIENLEAELKKLKARARALDEKKAASSSAE